MGASPCFRGAACGHRRRGKPVRVYAVSFALFSLTAHAFHGYGYAYIQYLPAAYRLIIIGSLACLMLLVKPRWLERVARWLSRHQGLALVMWLSCGLAAFWFFRTRIHVFMGDGATSTLPARMGVSLRRLDDLVRGLFHFYVLQVVPPAHISVLPSVFAAQVYSLCCGLLTIATLVIGFRSQALLPLVFLSMPWVFNFFGNVDSYAFSVWYAILFATVASRLMTRREALHVAHVLLMILLWGVGLWVHPFHLFLGFLVVLACCQWLQQRWWPAVPTRMLVAAYGVALFVFVKTSDFSNNLTTTNSGFVPPFFSWQTATHYANNLLLPLLPLLCFAPWRSGERQARASLVLLVLALASLTFFTMAFTLGACDQFNYHHLLAILACYFLPVFARFPLPARNAFFLAVLHALVLIPMVLVHSSPRTIQRAWDVFPQDKCHHNCVMSWQTHLGIILADNIQPDSVIESNVLAIFRNGAEAAEPPGFRFGNYVYHVAFHYNYGRIDQGRKLLSDLLKRHPEAVRFLLSERPAFIFHNRELLWDDVLRFFPARNEAERGQLGQVIERARAQARTRPYFIRTSAYEVNVKAGGI